ncbi:MAG: hypothetical protein AAF938_26720 [Myxococcota bacterium]
MVSREDPNGDGYDFLDAPGVWAGVSLRGEFERTPTVTNSLTPEWSGNDAITVTGMPFDAVLGRINVQLWDADPVGADDLIADCRVLIPPGVNARIRVDCPVLPGETTDAVVFARVVAE